MKRLLILISMMFCISTVAELESAVADSSFRQSNRDRMIRLEEGLKATNERMYDGFKFSHLRADDLKDSLNNNFRLLIDLYIANLCAIFLLFAVVFWDRRTTIAPVVKATRELELRTEKLEYAIKEKAEKDSKLKEASKHAGLL